DGIERLVVDVVVRQGRAIQLEDNVAPAIDAKADEEPAAAAPAPADAEDAIPAENEMSLNRAPLPAESSNPPSEETSEKQLAMAGIGLGPPLRRVRGALRKPSTGSLPLTTAHRILRRR